MFVRAQSIFVSALLLFAVYPASAQESQEAIERLFPSGDPLDPLSTGNTGSLAEVELASPRDVPPESEVGEVLAAIPGVRETEHHVFAHLRHGLASVTLRQVFAHSGRFAAEVLYRVPLPDGARLGSLEVCNGSECRAAEGGNRGEFDDSFGLDGGLAGAHIQMEDGYAMLRVAPLRQGQNTEVRWSYVAPARVRGGVARMVLPKRGHDLRVAPARVTFIAEGYESASIQEEVLGTRARLVEPWSSTQLYAQVRPGRRTARSSYRCGGRWCTREYVESSVSSRRPVNLALALDVSPSTRGPARGRSADVVRALVRGLPSGSHVRAAAVAGRSVSIMERREVREVPQDLSARGVGLDLGAASRLDTVVDTLQLRRGDLMVVVGDGGLTPGEELRAPPGVRVHYIQVVDRDVDEAIRAFVGASGGQIWDASSTEGDALFEQLLSVTASGSGVGQSRTLRGRRGAPVAGARAIAMSGEVSELAVAGRANHAARAGEFPAASEPTENAATSFASEPVLSLLRSRLIPAARACLRSDRRGREDHSVRAVYELTLADQEVVSAAVRGEMPDALRVCLRDAAGRLEVPAFAGRVQIRYPLYTQGVTPAPSVALDGAAGAAVDATFGNEPTTPDAVLQSF
ncbi:MAG: hypothetical protein AB8H86_29910 [Polyangiales bacterium]